MTKKILLLDQVDACKKRQTSLSEILFSVCII